MKNSLLYIVTVLIWGSTWLAIEFQLGEVAVEVSIFYRFAIAALIMWAYCLWKRVPLRFSLRNHGFILLLALGNFSINYMLMYLAQEHLTSAMTSIAFSTMLLMNIINTRLFFGKRIEPRTYVGACIGVLGIVVLFWNDLQSTNLSASGVLGLMLVLSGTLVASFGNMVSVRNSNNGLNILAVNAWGMLYGSAALAMFAIYQGSEFTISSQPSYIISLLYLAIFGTVIAFATYFVLLRDIGPEKASYVIVFFPIVAVFLSSLFEGFVLTNNIFIGFLMVLLGNLILLTPTEKIARFLSHRRNRISEH
ncbi:MAG: EamA family transporter [Pseudomonadota bacterium]